MIDDEKWINVRITRRLHTWVLDKGKKAETFDDVIARLVGMEPSQQESE